MAKESVHVYNYRCKQIETDLNYYSSGVTNHDLFSLIMNEDGSARHRPREKTALAIFPFDEKDREIGRLYQIKMAINGDDNKCPVSYIDDTAAILVRKDGRVSFHESKKAKQDDFSNELTHLTLGRVLGQKSVHSYRHIN